MSSTARDYGRGKTPGDPRSPSEKAQSNHHRSREYPPAVICDFDGTTAVENVAELLFERLGDGPSWMQLREDAREKKIGFKQYQEGAFRSIGASKEAMQSLVKGEVTLRPYFKDLWRYCRGRGIRMAILTVGLDFYVDALLEREGLEDVPRYAVNTHFGPMGITFEYPYTWDGSGASSFGDCREWGNCKCSVLRKYRKGGHSILYVGDGRSDLCAASTADWVFARGQLPQLCRENQVPYTEFRDFRDVIHGLEDLLAHAPGAESWAPSAVLEQRTDKRGQG